MASPILVSGGTLIDGNGGDPVRDCSLLLSGDEVIASGDAADQEVQEMRGRGEEVRTLDATGATVMPGLVDAHTHLSFGEPNGNDELFSHRTEAYSSLVAGHDAQKVLRAGVTSVLDADCLWNIGVELRDAIEANVVEGPRMRVGGNAMMTSVGGTAGRFIRDEGRSGYATVVRNRDEIVAEVRRQIKYGVDWIKVHVTGLIPNHTGGEVKVWSLDELRAVCDTAHELHTPVVGHCRDASSTRDSALAGMDLIYHSSYMDEPALEAVVDNGSALCPTFTLLGNLADYGDRVGTAPELLKVFRAEIEETARMVGEAHRAGVPVLCGSESGFAITPVGEWHARELEMLVEYMGFTPMEAIVAGTRNGAIGMRMPGEIGTLDVGRRADVLVVDGDPTRDVTILQRRDRLRHVVSRGEPVDLEREIPQRRIYPGEKVRTLAACPLTQSVALEMTDEELRELSRV